MPMARPTMEASARGVLKTRCGAEFGLQSRGDLENAALALHLGEIFFAAAIGHVFAEDQDVWDCGASLREAWR